MTEERIHERLRKLLALTESPNEHESALAAAKLQELLLKHNLSMADLEKKGAKAPEVGERPHDLGKAAFKWKLDLAEGIAEFYYCHPMVNRTKKTVSFIGRPDNVESLTMLYSWVIDRIKEIARDERRKHFDTTGQHIDPLRWQLGFGEGAVSRLVERLKEMKARHEEDMARNEFGDVTALAVHHKVEVSDFLEQQYGYRTDGRPTKSDLEWEARMRRYTEEAEQREKHKSDLRAKCEAAGEMEVFYEAYPSERPDAIAKREKEAERERKKAEAEYRAREKRREESGYYERQDERWNAKHRKEQNSPEAQQKKSARRSGEQSADRINLQPFLSSNKPVQGSLD